MRKLCGRISGFAVGIMLIGTIGSSNALAAPAKVGSAVTVPAQMTEAAAKTHITDENYTDVTNLHRVKDGWTANAKSLGSPVSLMITDTGNINQQ